MVLGDIYSITHCNICYIAMYICYVTNIDNNNYINNCSLSPLVKVLTLPIVSSFSQGQTLMLKGVACNTTMVGCSNPKVGKSAQCQNAKMVHQSAEIMAFPRMRQIKSA